MSMTIGNQMNVGNNYSSSSTNKSSEYKNVRDYSNYLKDKYACLTPGKNVAVSVTSGMLRKAMSDEKTGQWLERELAKAPDYIKAAQQSAISHGSKLTSVSIEFGEEYSTMTTVGVFGDTGTDSTIEKWLEKIKESKEEQKTAEKKAEKKAGEENSDNQKISEQTYTFKGKDLKSVTDSFIQKMSTLNSKMNYLGGFNMKI
ncbi:MAG: hypothetical protein IJY85_11285 [Ruminococcus sp.]|nr:hypothetical protein [Ruminococcus sp.]